MRITVRELNSRLSEYLRQTAAGKEVVLASRGSEVARLVPPRTRHRSIARESELITRFRGLAEVHAGRGKTPPLPKPLIEIGKDEKLLVEIVSEQR